MPSNSTFPCYYKVLDIGDNIRGCSIKEKGTNYSDLKFDFRGSAAHGLDNKIIIMKRNNF